MTAATTPYEFEDDIVIALTLYAEAHGEKIPSPIDNPDFHGGYLSVGEVILNRAAIAEEFNESHSRRHPQFGDGSLVAVCLAQWQFSCWNTADPQRPILIRLGRISPPANPANPDFILALKYANLMLEDNLEAICGHTELTKGATHYLTKNAYEHAPSEHWCKSTKMLHTVDIGNHKFFRER